ncbi:recombination mediator RecR [Wolinella succinogenes]|uniref:Recombination protein RecR n=1 Tax=Wolinella succinogenes (strain ATCC 29543 / DSM 1740 / CCUG 13145 / JCM 31913 / LMG 7466 / NCTC 11488 / FDC 602W) TaxID=273121 RepID=Q7M9T2_WOLSU|nr:recombination mediator RecR [Wolinella succinogenes]CAE09825.1 RECOMBINATION PROTEIN [Wolinella succinogenes]VEG82036.1 Recombination protein RecR [Wolinella succinogenes]HCZ19442.1 recombination protein RecR [Helicobacter sp.]
MKKGMESFFTLVESLEKLPSVGRKSALRLGYFLAIEEKFSALKLAHAIEEAVVKIKRCERCGALSEHELCEICSDETRLNGQLCIVTHPKDIFILEESKHFEGRYFVIDSLEDCDFTLLRSLIVSLKITEVIFAFSPSLSNDSIIFYVEDKLQDLGVSFSKIAQGVPTGVSLENIDQLSLTRAFDSRIKL